MCEFGDSVFMINGESGIVVVVVVVEVGGGAGNDLTKKGDREGYFWLFVVRVLLILLVISLVAIFSCELNDLQLY